MTGRVDTIPAAILTGFLGSGKTTVLNRLVRDTRMARALVVINELGDIGLDHELIERASGDVLLLSSGCLCCTMRSDLVETLEQALHKARAGAIPIFDRVVVETTGLADPEPILQAFLADPTLARQFDLRCIVATVDAVLGDGTLDRHVEAVKQAAVADRLLLTKTDLASGAEAAALRGRLRRLNKTAPIEHCALDTPLDPSLLWDARFSDIEAGVLHAPAYADQCAAHQRSHCAEPGCVEHGPAASLHNDHVQTFSFVRDAPIDAELLDRWLTSFLDLRGPHLLRFKAIVNVAGLAGPLVLHGVQHVIHPPTSLKQWPSTDRRTRMVFITHGVEEGTIRNSLDLLGET